MADPRAAVGAAGEQAAAAEYEADGYAICARNWTCPGGEIDLIARRADQIVFIEVRTVTTAWLRSPTLTVSAAKQARVSRAADRYLRLEAKTWKHVRFDVVGVVIAGGSPVVSRLENAFVPRWAY